MLLAVLSFAADCHGSLPLPLSVSGKPICPPKVPLGGSKAGPFRAYAPVSLLCKCGCGPSVPEMARPFLNCLRNWVRQRSETLQAPPGYYWFTVRMPVVFAEKLSSATAALRCRVAEWCKVPSNLGGEQRKTECSGYFFGWIWDMVVGGMRHGMR